MSEFTISQISQIAEALSVPFYSSSVEWKPQAVSADKKRALAAAYVDMREYEDRLDKVFPQWSSSVQFLMTEKKVAAVVSLTVAGVTRVNVGEASLDDENAFTSAYAQGFKRVCSDFGLGRYLYRLPQVWCDYDEKKRAIVGAPELPEWARHPEERTVSKATAEEAATENESGETAADALPNPGETRVHFGKMNGKTLAQIWAEGEAGQGWVRWCANKYEPSPDDQAGKHLKRMAQAFIAISAR